MKHKFEIPHHFITIEGNIGAGKTVAPWRKRPANLLDLILYKRI